MNQVFDHQILYPEKPCPHSQESHDGDSLSSTSSCRVAAQGKKNSSGVVSSPIPRRVSIKHGLPNPSDDESLGHDEFNDNNNDDDEMARAMTTLMSRNDGSVKELGSVLIERAVLVDSIKWLSSHLPGCVLDDLSFHIASSLAGSEQSKKINKVKHGMKRNVLPIDYAEEYYDHISNSSSYATGLTSMCASSGSMSSIPAEAPYNRRSSTETVKRSNLRESYREIHLTNSWFETPYVTRYESALLFVDISGFTQLSSLLDAESLSRVCSFFLNG